MQSMNYCDVSNQVQQLILKVSVCWRLVCSCKQNIQSMRKKGPFSRAFVIVIVLVFYFRRHSTAQFVQWFAAVNIPNQSIKYFTIANIVDFVVHCADLAAHANR